MNSTRIRPAGAILAGGRSRRFGRDKALAELLGEPLICHVTRALEPVVSALMLSIGDGRENTRGLVEKYIAHQLTGGFPESAETHRCIPALREATLLQDERIDCGPLAGLEACLKHSPEDWVLVVACDLPFVNIDALQKLVDAIDSKTEVVVARSETGRVQPLCACYHRSLLSSLSSALDRREPGVRRWVATINSVREVCLPDAVLHNVNRPEDLDIIK